MASAPEPPENTTADTTVGELHEIGDKNPLIHFGEVFRSFRSLLKRYNTHEIIGIYAQNAATSYNIIARPSFPFLPTFTYKADLTEDFVIPVEAPAVWGDSARVFAVPTLMGYLGTAFVGWRGSTRWYISVDVPNTIDSEFIVSRADNSAVYSAFYDAYPSGLTEYEYLDFVTKFAGVNPGHDGVIVQIPQINNSVTFDLPFYSRFRFAPSRWLQNFKPANNFYGTWNDDACFWMPSWILKTTYNPAGSNIAPRLHTMVSAGDDFNFVFYIGPPPLYLDIPPPAPPGNISATSGNDSPLPRLKRTKLNESVTEI
jgi:hypothetical protein